MRRLAAIADLDCEGMLVDLWGVVHDGERLHDGVHDALVALRERGVRVVFLTNTSQLGLEVEARLVKMGVPRDTFASVVSSGDVTRAALVPIAAGKERVFHIGSPSFVPWLFAMGIPFVEALDDVDLLVATGTGPRFEHLSADLAPHARRGVPLVCTNPDRVLPSKVGLVPAPGAVAHVYQGIGGPTHLFGKPHAPIYREALARLGVPKERVVAVGDMIETDVAGARAAGITSVLVTTGVHASELGDAPTDDALEAAFATHGARPDAILSRFGARR